MTEDTTQSIYNLCIDTHHRSLPYWVLIDGYEMGIDGDANFDTTLERVGGGCCEMAMLDTLFIE